MSVAQDHCRGWSIEFFFYSPHETLVDECTTVDIKTMYGLARRLRLVHWPLGDSDATMNIRHNHLVDNAFLSVELIWVELGVLITIVETRKRII